MGSGKGQAQSPSPYGGSKESFMDRWNTYVKPTLNQDGPRHEGSGSEGAVGREAEGGSWSEASKTERGIAGAVMGAAMGPIGIGSVVGAALGARSGIKGSINKNMNQLEFSLLDDSEDSEGDLDDSGIDPGEGGWDDEDGGFW